MDKNELSAKLDGLIAKIDNVDRNMASLSREADDFMRNKTFRDFYTNDYMKNKTLCTEYTVIASVITVIVVELILWVIRSI